MQYNFQFRDHDKCEEWKSAIACNIERMRHSNASKSIVHRGSHTSRFGSDPKLGGNCICAFRAKWVKDSSPQEHEGGLQSKKEYGYIGIFPEVFLDLVLTETLIFTETLILTENLNLIMIRPELKLIRR